MGRLLAALTILLLVAAGPARGADVEGFFAPESELAGWLWPAAFSLYLCRTVALDVPAAYVIDTPRVVATIFTRKETDSVGDLVADLQDPYLTVKDPIAADLRRRTGQDFGYADASPRAERQRAVAQWVKWARENQAP